MNKFVLVERDFINSRIDKWIKRNICQVPQGLIEKILRNKNVTVNKLKVKSSYKLKVDDKIYLHNFNPIFSDHLSKKKNIYPAREILKIVILL